MANEEDLAKSMEAASKPVRAPRGAVPKPQAAQQSQPAVKGPTNLASRLSPSAHKQASRQVVIADELDGDTALHMAFLGSGQGGSRIANAFWEIGYRRVGIFNTTDSDFKGIAEEAPKLNLDIGGARKDMFYARKSLEGREEEVWDLMQRAWGNTLDCALVCVGLGGGSGSGTALPLVQHARKYMESKGRPPRVGCVLSLPSVAEGQQVARNAVTAFHELVQARVSPIIIIDNARVNELYKPGMSQLLPKSNEVVSQLLHLFNTLGAAQSPYITFDRSEFTQLMDGGIVVMGAADIPVSDITSPADISTAIREQLANSVLAQVDLRKGSKAACIFVGSQDVLDSFSLDYFDAGFTQLDRIIGSSRPAGGEPTVIHRGLYPGVDPGLQCYTLISELEPPVERLRELAHKGNVVVSAGSSLAKHLKVE